MEFLKEQYRQSIDFLRGPLQIYLKNTVIAFFVIWVIFFAVCLFRPDVLSMLIEYIQSVVENANISGIIKLGQERRGLNIDLQFFAEKDIKNKALYHYKGLFVNFERVLKNMRTRLTIRNNSIRIGIRLTNDTK